MPCSDLRFLVVEDHPVQQLVLSMLVQNLGASQVHLAADGAQAIEVIRDEERQVDIIVSDLNMPEMDGWDLIRSLGAVNSSTALIITSALSAKTLSDVSKMAVAYGVNLLGAVTKPVSAVKLVPLVRLYRSMKTQRAHMSFRLGDIASALSRNEFEPAFEPQVRLASARVVGMHVGPRWRHPEFGLLEANAFMPSAEACGLIDNVAAGVLRMSLQQARRWRENGNPLRLSLSLREAQLIQPDFAHEFLALTRDSGVEPSDVTLCTSDGSFGMDRALSIKNMTELQANGFRLAIEYFRPSEVWSELGAGVFTELKISPNLVSGLKLDASGHAGLIQALDTADRLGLAAVAAGIESLDEWNLLQSWQCKYGQGPFIGPPLSSGAVLPWLLARQDEARASGPLGRALELAVRRTPSKPGAPSF